MNIIMTATQILWLTNSVYFGSKSSTGLKFFRPYFHDYLSSVHNCENRFHIRFFNRLSHMLFSYIYRHLFITSRVYLEPTYLFILNQHNHQFNNFVADCRW